MAFKKIRNDGYIADTKEDLLLINEKDLGAECYVIKEACEYKLMSTGEWIKQTRNSSGGSGADIDLSDYATEQYVDKAISEIEIPSIEGLATEEFVEEAIANIEIPSVDLTGLASETYVDEAIAAINAVPVMKMFAEDAGIMASNPGSQFGIALNKGDTRTLPEAMLEKGIGMYSFWIHKSNQSLPTEALAKNSSCRGLCCVDTVKPTGWYGWIILVDQDGDSYVQYIRNSNPQGWKALVDGKVFEDYKAEVKSCYLPRKYEIADGPAGTIIDYCREKEIRILCPEGTEFTKHSSVGEGGNPNIQYMTFITYAPEGAVSMKEGDRGTIIDEMIPLDGGSGCGTDKFGRKFKKHWFALASYNESTDAWTYYGATSNETKYIGWTYIVNWYDANGRIIDMDMIRINLSNEACHLTLEDDKCDCVEEMTTWNTLSE